MEYDARSIRGTAARRFEAFVKPLVRNAAIAPEARSGLDPWTESELPVPPTPKGLAWLGILGPGVIVLGVSLGSGEFLLGPAAFVRYGLALLWVTVVSSLFQVIFNTELMRYTLATGEPVYTGFMRTRPSSTFWAWFYAILHFLQTGWPGWAGTAAGAIYFLFARRLAGTGDASTVYYIGVGTFLVCVLVLMVGRHIERTLEILNWILVVGILGSFLILAVLFVAPSTWFTAIAGMFAFDLPQGWFLQFSPR
jgi:Mn2+/Fe2+ NRAMP family transporter